MSAEARRQLMRMYVDELHWLAAAVTRGCEGVFADAQPPLPGSNYFKVAPDLHARIAACIAAAANIRKLVEPRPRKTRYDTDDSLAQRNARTAFLTSLLEGIDLGATMSDEVRDSLEHFDERLDTAFLELQTASGAIVVRDMALGDWEPGSPLPLPGEQRRVVPVRLYAARSRIFYNFHHSADLGRLHGEARAIAARLVERKLVPEEPGGMIIPLG